MPPGAVDRIRVTTVVDNYIDNLRQDDAIARRYSAFVAGKMPDLRAEHGLAHLVEVTRGSDRFTVALDFGLTPDTMNHNFRALACYGGVAHFRPRWQQRGERRVYSGRLSRDEIERYDIDVRLVAKPMPIAEGLWLSGEMHAT